MKIEQGKARTANLILPFALFGFLAPIATYLVAVSNLSINGKTVILSVLAGSYALLFGISYQRLRATVNESEPSNLSGSIPELLSTNGGLSQTRDGSFLDARTGLANRRGFELVFERELAECLRNPDDRTMSLLVIEIADFEKIREMYGQDGEDRLLRYAAEKIDFSIRNMDVAALVDNGEFAIVLPTADESGAMETSRRIFHAFADEMLEIADEDKVPVGVFIGNATFPKDGEAKESLMARAASRKLDAKASVHRGAADPTGEYLN